MVPELDIAVDKISLVLRLPSKNPEESKAAIDMLINDTIKEMQIPI